MIFVITSHPDPRAEERLDDGRQRYSWIHVTRDALPDRQRPRFAFCRPRSVVALQQGGEGFLRPARIAELEMAAPMLNIASEPNGFGIGGDEPRWLAIALLKSRRL